MSSQRTTQFYEATSREHFWNADQSPLTIEQKPTDHANRPSTEWRILSLETLKGFAFFIPGTIVLGLIGVVSSMIAADIVFFRSWESLPATMAEQLTVLTVAGTIAALMIWFGVGRLRRLDHSLLPISVFGTGFLIGTICIAFEAVFGTRGDFIEFFTDNSLIIYLLPIFLVVPVLLREWIGRTSDNEQGTDF